MTQPSDPTKSAPDATAKAAAPQAPAAQAAAATAPSTQPAVVGRPQTIKIAVGLMLASVVFVAIAAITVISNTGSAVDALESAVKSAGASLPAGTGENKQAITSAIKLGTGVIAGLEIVGFLWMAWKNWEGRKWARIVATILCVFMLWVIYPAITIWGGLALLAGIVAVVMLWQTASSAYYNSVSAQASGSHSK